MSSFKKLSAAEKARASVLTLRQRLQRTSVYPPDVPDLLPAIEGDNYVKLKKAHQGLDITISISELVLPDGAREGDTFIALLRNGSPITEFLEVPFPPPTPYPLVVPKVETATPGRFELKYKVLYGTNENDSPPTLFYVDNLAPNHDQPGNTAAPPAEIADGVVTLAYLDSVTNVVMDIDSPDDMATGDVCTGYYGKSIPGIPVGRFTVTSDFSVPVKIDIPSALMKLGSDGEYIFYYVWEDRVGNVGKDSVPFNFELRLTPTPAGLQPPLVPENDDGVVDLKDAFPDVAVVIPPFTNGRAGDQVRVSWGTIVQPLKPTDGTAQVIVDVPFADVAQGGDGPKDVLVTYEIVRDSARYPETVGLTVNVNLTIPGPVNPEPDPELGNPNLLPVVVTGAVSTTPDELTEEDIGSPATATVTIYDGFKLGDLVDLYWDGVLVPAPGGRYTVVGDEAPDADMSFSIASSIFEATNNGIKKVHYVITNPTENGENENPSPRTDVDVYIYPVTLPDPEVRYLSMNPAGKFYLDCKSLRDIPVVGSSAVIRVPGGGSLEAGMVLEFTWSGTHTPPGPTPIEDYVFEKQLQNNEHVNGFEVYLPFTAALKPITDGDGSIVYTATVDGRTHTSKSHDVRVIVINDTGEYCDGTFV